MIETDPETPRLSRVLGRHDEGREGPTVLFLGGIHGNEPAGLAALTRVLRRLGRGGLEYHGRFHALAGNLAALERGQRFLDRDLNRAWEPHRIRDILDGGDPGDRSEDGEQGELIRIFQQALQERGGSFLFVDLHTSSAMGAPFTCLGDTLDNRRLALSVPIPMILGLEECIDGAVLEFFNERGIAGLAIEGGKHDTTEAVDNLEAAIWILLVEAGAIPRDRCDLEPFRETLRRAAGGLPPILQIRERRALLAGDGFVMEPGFESFQLVAGGTRLGRDHEQVYFAPHEAYVLLPLYQGLGEDGYFLATSVHRFWLRISSWFRVLGNTRLLALLPGLRLHPHQKSTLIVRSWVAQGLTLRLFHLLGYRRQRKVDGGMQFTRRWARRENDSLRPRSSRGSS